MTLLDTLPESIKILRNPETIRNRCHAILALGLENRLSHFVLRPEKLDSLVDQVLEISSRRYPDGDIPYHSRYRHFSAGGIDRLHELREKLAGFNAEERCVRLCELVLVSVLLDAGAGANWKYRDRRDEKHYNRSEGLAVASFDMFIAGHFSSDKDDPLRADALGLQRFNAATLAEGFQVSDSNPLVGLEGRANLLRQLGACVGTLPEFFSGTDRPGRVVPVFAAGVETKEVAATDLLMTLLTAFADIWPGRITQDGHNLGDVWRHRLIETGDETTGLIPFHKLSQWLTYSFFEPLEESGYCVSRKEALTGLAEYRNGGLFLDGEVLELKNPENATRKFRPEEEIIVEWRALTVALLDELLVRVREKLKDSEHTPGLAQILEGGTWALGRELAFSRRKDGSPPLAIESDGTVF